MLSPRTALHPDCPSLFCAYIVLEIIKPWKIQIWWRHDPALV